IHPRIRIDAGASRLERTKFAKTARPGDRRSGTPAELPRGRASCKCAMIDTLQTESLSAPEAAAGARLRDRAIVRIHLLGPMQATTYLGSNILPHGSRARALLGYLCLAGGVHVSRARLAGLLWDRVSERSARANLRQALRELSSTFGKFSHELIISGRD